MIKMKLALFMSALLLILLLVGCSKVVVCNKPYILVGTDCCLDKDDNSICDKDELTGLTKTTPTTQADDPLGACEKTNNTELRDYCVYVVNPNRSDVTMCDSMKTCEYRDRCYYEVAQVNNDINICDYIGDTNDGEILKTHCRFKLIPGSSVIPVIAYGITFI